MPNIARQAKVCLSGSQRMGEFQFAVIQTNCLALAQSPSPLAAPVWDAFPPHAVQPVIFLSPVSMQTSRPSWVPT